MYQIIIYWNTNELVSNNIEGMDLLERQGQEGKSKNLSSSTPLYRLSAEGVSQIICTCLAPSRFGLKAYVFQLQKFILEVLSTYFKLSKTFSQVCPPFLDFS